VNRLKLFLPLIVFVAVAIFLWRGLFIDPSHLPSALIDKPLPSFALPNLQNTEQTLTEKDFIGEPFLINVWATWCASCRIEHPFMNKLSEQGVKIIGLNYKDEDAPAQQWLSDFGNPYDTIIADREGKLGLDLGVYGAPETFVVDAKGVIRYKHVGVVDERVWRSKIAPIYNE